MWEGPVHWGCHWGGPRYIRKEAWQAIGSKPVDVIPPCPPLHSVPASPALDDSWWCGNVKEIDLLLPVMESTTERERASTELPPLLPGTMKSWSRTWGNRLVISATWEVEEGCLGYRGSPRSGYQFCEILEIKQVKKENEKGDITQSRACS